MRATLRITWLLLSLSFLFYIVCAVDPTQSSDSVAKATASTSVNDQPAAGVDDTIKSVVTTSSVPKNAETSTPKTTATTAPVAGKKNDATPTPSKSTVVVNEANTATITAIKSHSSPQQAAASTTNPPALTRNPGTSPSTVSTPVVTTSVTTKNVITSGATDSSHSSKVPTKATTAQINPVPVASKVPGALVTFSGNPIIGGVTTTTVAPKDVTTVVSSTHISPTSSMSQGSSSGVVTKKTSKESQETTTPRPPLPTGNPKTISSPSSQTQTRAPAQGTTGTRAGTTLLQTTTAAITTTITTTTTTTTTAATTTTPSSTASPQPKKFVYSPHSGQETKEERHLAEVCKRLMPNWLNGTCILTWRRHNGTVKFDCVEINGKVQTGLAEQYYEEITEVTKKSTDNKTLIAILASCGALLIMIVILAVCASHHRKPYNENQQHLTEELHPVENGYHDNPTLEVMEVQPEMQEKKVALNGEFNDSWIVPIDNLLKDDAPDEEDTHL